MRAEKIVWWIFIVPFLLGSFLLFFHLLALGALAAAHPEFAAFLVGLVGFWLFANRLVFGYGALANMAYALLKGHEPDRETLLSRVRHRVNKPEEWSTAALLALWQGSLEPFKYAYYLGFFLVFAGAALFELNFFGGPLAAWAAKGLMFGAAIPTLLILSLELLANHYVSQTIS